MQRLKLSSDFFIGIGLLIFSSTVHSWALDFTTMEDVSGVGAEVFPRVFAKALMVLAVLLAAAGLKADPGLQRASFKGLPWAALMACTCFVFVALLPFFGYLILSPIFAVTVTVIATRRLRIWDQVPVLCIVVGIYFIFAYLLRVPVPHGVLA